MASFIFFFFFSSRRRHTRSKRDWSSDVCSSDLEAWSNAVRHGAARRIAVTLAARRGGIEIVVTDDGRGFDTAQTLSSTGVGVRSMIERLQRRGGRLNFASTPGQGAEMRAWMPVSSG